MERLTVSLLEATSEAIDSEFSSLIDDLILVVIERDPARFLNAQGVPMSGAEQSFVRFDFDWPRFALALEDQLASALRAGRLKLPRGNDAVCHATSLPDYGLLC